MDAERVAAVRRVLAWLDKLARGNVVVERWRAGLLEELAALEAGKERAA